MSSPYINDACVKPIPPNGSISEADQKLSLGGMITSFPIGSLVEYNSERAVYSSSSDDDSSVKPPNESSLFSDQSNSLDYSYCSKPIMNDRWEQPSGGAVNSEKKEATARPPKWEDPRSFLVYSQADFKIPKNALRCLPRSEYFLRLLFLSFRSGVDREVCMTVDEYSQISKDALWDPPLKACFPGDSYECRKAAVTLYKQEMLYSRVVPSMTVCKFCDVTCKFTAGIAICSFCSDLWNQPYCSSCRMFAFDCRCERQPEMRSVASAYLNRCAMNNSDVNNEGRFRICRFNRKFLEFYGRRNEKLLRQLRSHSAHD